VRIGHACRLLADTSSPISVIAARSGFPNTSNFNRQFRALKDSTPAAYRRQFTNRSADAGKDQTPLTTRSPSLEQKRGAIGR
jgi:AraC-like DNA-binding protein